ncbi:MAG TPA: S49 family peptidase, partial [Thermoanaerobaculia bacterium]|nr:S49 family peptidase [Thermoanaerobaculia bacterium]
MKRLAVIFLVLVGIAFLAAFFGILAAGHGRGLAGPTVLVWRMDRPVVEQAAEAFPLSGTTADSLTVLYPAFRAARSDRGVRGLALYIESTDLGLGKAQELRRQLAALRQAGKFVECYLETAGEGSNGTLAYYLATACDHIFMAPSGDFNVIGLYTQGMFLKGSLEKLKVDPQFHHAGAYKSAAEIFTESRWSAPAEEAINAVLDRSFEQIVTAIAQARKLSPEAVRQRIDDAPFSAPEAMSRGLIDGLSYPDEFRARLVQRSGGRARLTRLQDYGRSAALGSSGPRIAVVVAQG